MSQSTLQVTTSLPADFRTQDFLAFHRRDKTAVAEIVTDNQVQKGVMLKGVPCLLTVSLDHDSASLTLDADAHVSPLGENEASQLLQHMLGLDQAIDAFEHEYAEHDAISRLLAHSKGLRIPQVPTPFEAITWAITGQLISVEAAVSIRRRLIEASNVKHSSGLLCLPDEYQLADTRIELFRQCGYSNSKATTIQRIAQGLVDGSLSLNLDGDPVETGKALLAVKGVGPWTVSYTLMRGFSWLDGSLHGDVAVRRNLQRLLRLDEKPTEKETQKWLEPFSPYRALVAAHLWAMQSDQGY